MSDKQQKTYIPPKINEKERWKYIGFDVFPKEPKDLFQSEEEKKKLVEQVRARLAHHEHLRSDCTLLEERVTAFDRIFLTIASVVMVLALFLPWYSVYNEIVEQPKPTQVLNQPTTPVATTEISATTTPGEIEATGDASTAVPAVTDTGLAAVAEPTGSQIGTEELITTVMARKKIHREFERLSGIGALISIGSIGSAVLTSGLGLMLTGLLFIIFTLLCLALPAYNLYGIYGLKGNPDAIALKLKKIMRLNWIPLVIFVAGLVFSFFGGEYSFNAAEKFSSLGAGYSPLTYLGTLSWGVYVSLAGFILCAAKGVEI